MDTADNINHPSACYRHSEFLDLVVSNVRRPRLVCRPVSGLFPVRTIGWAWEAAISCRGNRSGQTSLDPVHCVLADNQV